MNQPQNLLFSASSPDADINAFLWYPSETPQARSASYEDAERLERIASTCGVPFTFSGPVALWIAYSTRVGGVGWLPLPQSDSEVVAGLMDAISELPPKTLPSALKTQTA